ncbi:MAG: hypothetical protein J6Y29_06400 [Clostridiales bacterium]|nr:hypothetical protein [Clostridiales bacterium]
MGKKEVKKEKILAMGNSRRRKSISKAELRNISYKDEETSDESDSNDDSDIAMNEIESKGRNILEDPKVKAVVESINRLTEDSNVPKITKEIQKLLDLKVSDSDMCCQVLKQIAWGDIIQWGFRRKDNGLNIITAAVGILSKYKMILQLLDIKNILVNNIENTTSIKKFLEGLEGNKELSEEEKDQIEAILNEYIKPALKVLLDRNDEDINSQTEELMDYLKNKNTFKNMINDQRRKRGYNKDIKTKEIVDFMWDFDKALNKELVKYLLFNCEVLKNWLDICVGKTEKETIEKKKKVLGKLVLKSIEESQRFSLLSILLRLDDLDKDMTESLNLNMDSMREKIAKDFLINKYEEKAYLFEKEYMETLKEECIQVFEEAKIIRKNMEECKDIFIDKLLSDPQIKNRLFNASHEEVVKALFEKNMDDGEREIKPQKQETKEDREKRILNDICTEEMGKYCEILLDALLKNAKEELVKKFDELKSGEEKGLSKEVAVMLLLDSIRKFGGYKLEDNLSLLEEVVRKIDKDADWNSMLSSIIKSGDEKELEVFFKAIRERKDNEDIIEFCIDWEELIFVAYDIRRENMIDPLLRSSQEIFKKDWEASVVREYEKKYGDVLKYLLEEYKHNNIVGEDSLFEKTNRIVYNRTIKYMLRQKSYVRKFLDKFEGTEELKKFCEENNIDINRDATYKALKYEIENSNKVVSRSNNGKKVVMIKRRDTNLQKNRGQFTPRSRVQAQTVQDVFKPQKKVSKTDAKSKVQVSRVQSLKQKGKEADSSNYGFRGK